MTEGGNLGRSWRDVKRDAIASRLRTQQAVEEAEAQGRLQARAFRLAWIRERSAMTRREVAELMHVSEDRVAQIESGEVDSLEVSTLCDYAEALGGTVKVVADFGDLSLTIVG